MDFINCPCSGANLPRFVQPVILALLSAGALHGYSIVQQLAATKFFRSCPPDVTGVYRVLKNMEQQGSLTSVWDTGESGPARKRYTITERGLHCLCQWEQTLREHQFFVSELQNYIREACSAVEEPARRMAVDSQLTAFSEKEAAGEGRGYGSSGNEL